jgi:hypothetical protein
MSVGPGERRAGVRRTPVPWLRRLLVVPALGALVLGAWGGLVRVGWALPTRVDWVLLHGPLMVCGLFGTLVALERAVALRAAWAYAGPLAGALGVVLALGGATARVAPLAFCGAALALLAASLAVVRRQSELFTWVMALGAAAWGVGNALWALGRPVFEVVGWWMGFLVLTIAAERLELSRLVRKPRWAQHAFALLVALVLVGLALGWSGLLGVGFVLLAAWLARFDVARRTVRQQGLARFAAVALLGGYAWLALGGGLLTLGPLPAAGLRYDAVLHAVLVGFVLSMVFAHAPIILPAVAKVALPYHPVLYAPLLVLHATLLARMAGDLWLHAGLRRVGALGNALALVVYLVAALVARALQARTAARRAAARPAVRTL